ncbi:MAG: carbohydrate kinase family protein [bacterium]|nr:carbohydrate kinase family protein [bacterium]
MTRFDVITIGSATQDVYLMSKAFRFVRDRRSSTGSFEEFAFGSKVELDDLLQEVGGGATNAAVTFQRQGLRTACVCKVGDDPAGDDVVRTLRSYKVDPRFVIRDHNDRTAFSALFLGKGGERTALVYRGASADFTESMVPWQALRARWFYISSLGGNLRFLRHAIAHAHRTGASVAVNPGKAELAKKAAVRSVLRQADVLLLNREEAELLFRVRGSKLPKAIAKWRKGIVVVTDGAKGSWTVTPTGAWRLRIKPVHAVDTTGAGDAFGSGFVASLAKRPHDIASALRLGAINSAGEVQHIGAKKGLVTLRLPKGPWMRLSKLKI